MAKVSILVPICNVENYLEKCLTSIVSQTLHDIEIICINDGSKDSSLDIIKKFADCDSRVVIIDKTNSGYGDSMNKGLQIASGKYIGIVESDDFVAKEMFEDLYNLALSYDADIVKSNYNHYWQFPTETFKYHTNLRINEITVDLEDCRKKVLWGVPAIWSAIYKKRLFGKK